MNRKPERKEMRYTNPDHRPMIPEFRGPVDGLDTAVRELRRRYEEARIDHKTHWR